MDHLYLGKVTAVGRAELFTPSSVCVSSVFTYVVMQLELYTNFDKAAGEAPPKLLRFLTSWVPVTCASEGLDIQCGIPARLKVPVHFSDTVRQIYQLLRETSGADQCNRVFFDLAGPLHCFTRSDRKTESDREPGPYEVRTRDPRCSKFSSMNVRVGACRLHRLSSLVP